MSCTFCCGPRRRLLLEKSACPTCIIYRSGVAGKLHKNNINFRYHHFSCSGCRDGSLAMDLYCNVAVIFTYTYHKPHNPGTCCKKGRDQIYAGFCTEDYTLSHTLMHTLTHTQKHSLMVTHTNTYTHSHSLIHTTILQSYIHTYTLSHMHGCVYV